MEKPTEQRADERGADSVQRPCSAINPEWTSLQNKPHLMPAICHPDAATIVVEGYNRLRALVQRLYALVVEHHECKIMREEHCVCPLCSQDQNKKTLEEAWNVFYSPNAEVSDAGRSTPESKGRANRHSLD